MALPLVITPGDLGHISHHEEIHAMLDPVVSPFTIAQDAQGTLAARPAAGTRGRYYLATDTMVLYRDSGTAWQPVHDMLETWNASLLAASSNLAGFRAPAAVAIKIVAQSCGNGTWTTMTFGSDAVDNDDMHSISANTDRITAQKAGIYLAGSEITFDANAVGNRRLGMIHSGGDVISAVQYPATLTGTTQIQTASLITLAAGEYFYAQGLQNSGGALDVLGGRLWAALVSTL